MSILFIDISQVPRTRVGKLWLTEQLWPASCFSICAPPWTVFTFLNGGGKKSKGEECYITCENYTKFQRLQVMFNCNTAAPIHSHTVWGCFCATREDWSSFNKDHVTRKAKNNYYLVILQGKKKKFNPRPRTIPFLNFF